MLQRLSENAEDQSISPSSRSRKDKKIRLCFYSAQYTYHNELACNLHKYAVNTLHTFPFV